MNFAALYDQLLKDFNVEDLQDEDKESVLLEIAKTIQKQFLLDIYDIVGPEKFEALQASAKMGDDFYGTTLKHLVPNYEDVFVASRMKIVDAFNKENAA